MGSKKSIVVTGASGFLGSHLISRLKDDASYEVYALSSNPDLLKDRVGGENIHYLHKNDLFRDGANSFIENSVIVNCAYPRNSTGTVIADGIKYIQRVFEADVLNNARSIINISSQSVYSQQRTEPANEQTPVCLESPYAVGKYAVELMLESICKGHNTAYTNIRMASLIGQGFDQRIVNRFVKQGLETGSINVKNNNQRFGFFDVEDAVSGIAVMFDSDEKQWKHVYNLGSRGAYSLVDIAETVNKVICSESGKKIQINLTDGDESGSSELDSSLHADDFGFAPKISLEMSISRILNGLLIGG